MDWLSVIIGLSLAAGVPAIVSALSTVHKIVSTSNREEERNNQRKEETSEIASIIESLLQMDQKVINELLEELSPKQKEILFAMLRQELRHSNNYKVSIENASGNKIELETSAYRAEGLLQELKKKQVDSSPGPAVAS